MLRGLFLFTAAMTVITTSVLMYEPQASQVEHIYAEPVKVPYLQYTISEVNAHERADRQNRNVIRAEHHLADADYQEPVGHSEEYGEAPEAIEEQAGAVSELVESVTAAGDATGGTGGEDPEVSRVDESGADPVLTYLGNYTITFYCACRECCGDFATGCTASGVAATEWHTVATGEQFEFGTELYIDGLGNFTVEDRGVDGDWIDVYVSDHQEALDLGMQYRDVYVVE